MAPPMKRTHKLAIQCWWWWDILAAVVSILSVVLILVVLSHVNDAPLASWTLPIQPNSLIAILTTVSKVALMTPVASAISQLKWHHFRDRPQPLADLQLYDDASRGPWGASMFFLGARKPTLAWMGASITILALGFEPTTQQVLSVETRSAVLQNATGSIGIAQTYVSKRLITLNEETATGALYYQSSLLVAATQGTVVVPAVDCPQPATQCSWEHISTIAMCAEVVDMTESYLTNCNTSTGSPPYDCTFTLPGCAMVSGVKEEYSCNLALLRYGLADSNLFNWKPTTPQPLYSSNPSELQSAIAIVRKVPGTRLSNEVLHIYFNFCTKTYANVTVDSARNIKFDSVKTNRLVPVDPEPKFSVEFVQYDGGTYNMSYDSMVQLSFNIYSSLMVSSLPFSIPASGGYAMHNFLAEANISQAAEWIADHVSGLLRNDVLGDNSNVTMVPGEARYMEVYTRVRWEWMILPLAEVLMAVGFLIASIISTRNEPVLKTSLVALLTYRLKGWTEKELEAPEPETENDVERRAKAMIAILQEDEHGNMGFLRRDSWRAKESVMV